MVGTLYGGYYPIHWQGRDGSAHDLADLQPKKLFYKRAATLSPSDMGRFLQSKRASVILAEYGPTGLEMLPVAKAAQIPLVVHFHGYDAFRADILESFGSKYPQLFEEAAQLIAVSKPMREQLISLGAPAEKVALVPYGIALDAFPLASPQLQGPVFVAVGRLVPKKGPQITIQAFAEVVKQVPEAVLQFIGDGVEEEACRKLVDALGLAENVQFLGVKTPAEVKEALQNCRAVVLHSLHPADGDSEGTPLSLIEAGACALPVVSTLHGGIPDLVLNGETGFLVAEGDVQAMADAVLRLAQQPKLAEEMGIAARIRMEAHYTEERYFARLGAILDNPIR